MPHFHAEDMSARPNPDLCCGSDLSIVNAARRSFDTQHHAFTKGDAALIQFLIRENHWLPFRHPQMSFSCDAPVFVARQLGKHQVGLSWSEVSRRYKTEGIAFYLPDRIRRAPDNAKQGTGPAFSKDGPISKWARRRIEITTEECYRTYELLLAGGVAPEQARMVLPQNMMVRWTWTGTLLAWLHLLKERSHPAAQRETHDFVMEHIRPHLENRFPHTMENLEWVQQSS